VQEHFCLVSATRGSRKRLYPAALYAGEVHFLHARKRAYLRVENKPERDWQLRQPAKMGILKKSSPAYRQREESLTEDESVRPSPAWRGEASIVAFHPEDSRASPEIRCNKSLRSKKALSRSVRCLHRGSLGVLQCVALSSGTCPACRGRPRARQCSQPAPS